MSMRRVVAIMPVYNEARHLRRVLSCVERQTFDRRRLYFIAVDGGSSDESAAILREWFERSGVSGCVLTNPYRTIPTSLNRGLSECGDEDIVARLDAHAVYGETYIADAVEFLEKAPANVGCVGCAPLPSPPQSFAGRVIHALYTNPMGLGGASFRFGDDVRDVEHVYLGVWRPRLLSALGGFNEALAANEDAELSARVRRAGYRILRVPLPCRFLIKRGLLGEVRQWNRYGFWRAKMLQQNPDFTRARHVISPAAPVVTAGLLCSPMRMLLLPAYAGYAFLVFRGRARGEPLSITIATLLYFPVLQFAFGTGMLAGLVTAPVNRRYLKR